MSDVPDTTDLLAQAQEVVDRMRAAAGDPAQLEEAAFEAVDLVVDLTNAGIYTRLGLIIDASSAAIAAMEDFADALAPGLNASPEGDE